MYSRSGIPNQKVVTLVAMDYFELSLTTADAVRRKINANGTYAPFVTSGTQPLGQDQWGLLYRRATVISSKLTIWTMGYTQEGAPASDYPIIAITLSNEDEEPTAEIYNTMMQANTKFLPLQMGDSGRPFKLSHTYNAKRWHNIKDIKDADGLEYLLDDSSDPGGLPEDRTAFWVSLGPSDKSAPAGAISLIFTARIEYKLLLKDPRILPPSVQ